MIILYREKKAYKNIKFYIDNKQKVILHNCSLAKMFYI